MNCSKCGRELPEGASFCPECGSSIPSSPENLKEPDNSEASDSTDTGAAATTTASLNSQSDVPSTNNGGGADAPSKTTAQSGTNKSKSLNKKIRYGIIAAVVVVVIILIIALSSTFLGGVSVDVARQAFANQSTLATNGAVSSNYTNESAYEITEFNIESEEAVEVGQGESDLYNDVYGTDKIRAVTCSGKVANESFETDFTAVVYVGKLNNEWIPLDYTDADILSATTIPLKGVDYMGVSSNSDATYSDFSSTLDESNGTYTSSASVTETYDFWFGTDTAQVTQEFTFNPDSGWEPLDDVLRNDPSTTYHVEGYVLEGTTSNDWVTSTINLHDGDDGSMSAEYSIVADIPADKTDWYKSFTSEGTAVATITHDYGDEDITLDIEDEENNVSINGMIRSLSDATYYADVITDDKWYTGIFASDSYDITFDKNLTYALSSTSDS